MSPTHYRKKPIVIEAMRFDGDHAATCDFFQAAAHEHFDGDGYQFEPGGSSEDGEPPEPGGTIEIDTLEGRMTVQLGDWIIRGVAGEFYPCKPDIFEQTYEAVSDGE